MNISALKILFPYKSQHLQYYLNFHLIDRETLKKEGVVRGLYAGTVPSLAANVAENSILFAAYGLCQKLVARTLSMEVSKLSTFSNGCAGNNFI